ncbi:MAG: carboxylating nicotinate-nucleotide diphosphorylase [Bacteriovoracia bacterium]
MQNQMMADIDAWLKEDGLGDGGMYWHKLPKHPVKAHLKIKSNLIFAGLPWFCAVFERLSPELGIGLKALQSYEGKELSTGTEIEIPITLTWDVAITGERLALNLLHRASSVATATHELVEIARDHGIQILDTRKTTPGLRALEKYAVVIGGGSNHRFTQVDSWMIKDNHKELMGIEGAVKFFRDLRQPYKTLILEIHSLAELEVARNMNVTHFLLDNFSPEDLRRICGTKKSGEFFEVSGGVNRSNIRDFMIPGIDAVSSGSLTQAPPPVDISFKFRPESL